MLVESFFKETPIFTQRLKELASDLALSSAGTGGIRKMRAPDPTRGKGKRGGLRVHYLDLPAKGRMTWEQGQRKPDGAASRLLEILSKDVGIAERIAS